MLICIVTDCWVFYWPVEKVFYQLILGALLLSIIYLLYKIWPYTALSKKEMVRVKSIDRKNELKIFSANVLEENNQYDKMLRQIKSSDADLVFLLETNAAWAEGTKGLKK